MAGDPIGRFNLSAGGVERCVRFVLAKSVPTLLLGGGGYDAQLTAKLWARLTAAALGAPALGGAEIPADDRFFLEYGPTYEFEADDAGGGRAKWTDRNSRQQLQAVGETARAQIAKMREAASLRRSGPV